PQRIRCPAGESRAGRAGQVGRSQFDVGRQVRRAVGSGVGGVKVDVVGALNLRVTVGEVYVGGAVIGHRRAAGVGWIQRGAAFDDRVGGAGENWRDRVIHCDSL